MIAPALPAGTVVAGRYTIDATIARGSRSTTYRALDATAREIALKLYDMALPPEVVAALRRAGELAAGMTSAALAPIDAGVDAATGATFVASELSARPSLAQLVQICPLAPPEAAALARSLARALGPLHERGLAHLALKPANVFVGPLPSCEIRVSDFGAPPAAPWMAPEQARGAAAGVEADVYGAALVVFFALSGRPFEDDVSLGATWDAAFRRALRPEPKDRYPSLDALADAFERAARGEPPLDPVHEEPPPVRAQARPRRGPLILAGAAACLLLLGAAILVVKLARRPATLPPPAASTVVAPVETASAASVSSVPSPAPSGTAEPVGSAAPEAEPLPSPIDPSHALLVVACTPSCDSVYVDGHPIPHAERGKLLLPGVHMVGANLAHHASKVQPILLRRGRVERLDVAF